MYKPDEQMNEIGLAAVRAHVAWLTCDPANLHHMEKLAHALGELELLAYDMQHTVAGEVERLRQVQTN